MQKENQDKVHTQSSVAIIFYIMYNFKSAKGWDYQADLAKHESQTDAAKGFGGKYGVQTDKQDKVTCGGSTFQSY